MLIHEICDKFNITGGQVEDFNLLCQAAEILETLTEGSLPSPEDLTPGEVKVLYLAALFRGDQEVMKKALGDRRGDWSEFYPAALRLSDPIITPTEVYGGLINGATYSHNEYLENPLHIHGGLSLGIHYLRDQGKLRGWIEKPHKKWVDKTHWEWIISTGVRSPDKLRDADFKTAPHTLRWKYQSL